jgi:hypothetical protein
MKVIGSMAINMDVDAKFGQMVRIKKASLLTMYTKDTEKLVKTVMFTKDKSKTTRKTAMA